MIAKGSRSGEIVDHAFISIDAVRTHSCNMYLKLHGNSRWEAIKVTRG